MQAYGCPRLDEEANAQSRVRPFTPSPKWSSRRSSGTARQPLAPDELVTTCNRCSPFQRAVAAECIDSHARVCLLMPRTLQGLKPPTVQRPNGSNKLVATSYAIRIADAEMSFFGWKSLNNEDTAFAYYRIMYSPWRITHYFVNRLV